MTEKNIDYICCFCGAQERRHVAAGEPPKEGCKKAYAGGSHFWMDSRRLDRQFCSRLKQGTAPVDETDLYYIGIRYAGGDDSPKYVKKIMEWYQRVADAGYEAAMLVMGDAYAKGYGVAKNAENAAKWYRKAADMGNTEAMIVLGLLYSNRENSLQDNAKALQWFRKSADGENEVAMLALGDAYASGEITAYAPAKAAKWYRKLAKLKTSPPDFIIGGASDGVPWTGFLVDVTSLNDSDSADGMARLGYAYEHGEAGVGKDMEKAVEWYQKAVKAGDRYSMFALGKAYELGRGVEQNWRKALEWYRKAGTTDLMASLEHSQKWRMMWAAELLFHSQIPINEKNQYCPRTKEELQELVNDGSVSLGKIDTAQITDMSGLFPERNPEYKQGHTSPFTGHCIRSDFSGITSWNVSNVTDMSDMFCNADSFNEDISHWDVSNVANMSGMFSGAKVFNGDISHWDVSNVTDMSYMFAHAKAFNGDIDRWDVSNVTDMSFMFWEAKAFNGDISHWDVSNVTNMSGMFFMAKVFNADISHWDVSNVTDMSYMFEHAKAFNGDIGRWDVSNVKNMAGMFAEAKAFNGDIGRWDVSNVTDMHRMFYHAVVFDGNIGRWDVSNVTDMSEMFCGAERFNGDISRWNVRRVKTMASMFLAARAFHQNISYWDAPHLGLVTRMFWNARAFTNDPHLFFSALYNAEGMIYAAIDNVRTIAESVEKNLRERKRKVRRKKFRTLEEGEIPMLGAIIGDIAGSPYECGGMKSKDFVLLSGQCNFTDDTVMTLAVGKAILAAGGVRERLAQQTAYWMRRLGNLYDDCRYGEMFREWLTDETMPAYHSFGNGAAMRVSPCAFAAKTLDEALDMARIVAAVTHDHPEGIRGAEATTAAVFLAKNGATKTDIKAYIEENHYYTLDFTLDSIRPIYEFDVTCQGSVPQAIVAFLESTDFEDAVKNAVSLNGDSDTLGAIAGAIAGAYYGIPSELQEQALDYLDEPLLALLTECKRAFAVERSG